MYKALYRKYRPKSLDDLIGQPYINQTLINTIISNNISHSYLFSGPRGTGKTSTARIFSKLVNCLNPINGKACENCNNCQAINHNETSDIIEIDAASNNGVEEIRELKNKINLVTANLKYKVYIIDEVHMLSTGAFNALLKTLEEPPEHIIFILATTDLNKVPATIVSRCQTFFFSRISNKDIITKLQFICEKENIEVEESVLTEIARLSDGGLRDAIGILDKLTTYGNNKIILQDIEQFAGIISNENIIQFLGDIENCQYENIITSIEKYDKSGKDFSKILTDLIYELRNKIVHCYINDKKADSKSLNLMKELCQLDSDIKMSSNIKIMFETRILKIINDVFDNKIISREIILTTNTEIEPKEKLMLKTSKTKNNMNRETSVCEEKQEIDNDKLIEKDTLSSIEPLQNTSQKEENIKNNNLNKEILINNAFCMASKELLNSYKIKWKNINNFILDNNFSVLANNIVDGSLRVASKDILVISFPYISIIEKLELKNDEYIKFVEKILEIETKIVFITDELWEKKKQEFILNKKNNKKMELMNEIKEVENIKQEKDIKNFDLNSNTVKNAIDIFGNDKVIIEGEKI